MSIPAISDPPTFPQPGDSGETFNERALDAFDYLSELGPELNAFAAALNAFAALLFTGTSTTSNTIAGSGTKNFTIETGRAFVAGQPVIITRTSSPTNYMLGVISGYDAVTGALSVTISGSAGAGSNITDWTIGLMPDTAALPKAGGAMSGLLTLAASLGLYLTPGGDPGAQSNGQMWADPNGVPRVRAAGWTYSAVLDTLAQTLEAKTLLLPTITGYLETVVAPAAGSAFTPNLSAGTEFYYQSNANTTITLPTAVAGKSFLIGMKYGGAHTLGWAGATVKWAYGITPTPTSSNGKWDLFGFTCLDGSSWLGWPAGLNF